MEGTESYTPMGFFIKSFQLGFSCSLRIGEEDYIIWQSDFTAENLGIMKFCLMNSV